MSYPKARFLDNFIPLKQGWNGPQLAGWIPGAPAKTNMGCVVHSNVMIPVADGVSLAADIYTPKIEGRYPAIVCFAAYCKELQSSGAPVGVNETGSPQVFTNRGYVHIIVSRRGMGHSQGQSVDFFTDLDVSDHEKVLAWAAQQPWCNGDTAMFGTSYYGMVQGQIAVLNPSSLKCFFAIEFCTDYFRHINMFGGAPQADFFALWLGANFTETQLKLQVPPIVRALLSRFFNSWLRRLWWPFLRKRVSKIMHGFQRLRPAPEYRKQWNRMIFDSKTRATAGLPPGPYQELPKIQVPFVAVHNPGNLNIHQFGPYELFEKAGTAADRKWFIISPPGYELPALHWQDEALAFFDSVLYKVDNGYKAQPPVRYWRAGTEDYATAAQFPVAQHQELRLYLSSNGDDRSVHGLTPNPGAGTNRWAAVPLNALLIAGFAEVDNQMLTYECPVQEDCELSGAITLNLKFSCNEIDSHIVARLGFVDGRGEYSALSLGSLRPSCRKIDPTRGSSSEIAIDIDVPQPLVRDEPVSLRFSLTPQPVVLRKGHRLRLDIASRTDLLISDQSHGRVQFQMQVPPYYSRNTIHYGEGSYIELQRITSPQNL